MLRWAAGLGAVTAEALADAQDGSLAAARARLGAAARAGQLLANRPLAARGTVYTLTRAGLLACGAPELGPARITPASAEHAIVCALAAARLARCYPDGAVLGEPELRLLARRPPAPWALVAPADSAGGRAHRPDLLLVRSGAVSAPVAVEVELTCKAASRLRSICLAWARSRQVAGVLYLAADGVIAAVERAIAEADAADRVLALPLSCLEASIPRATYWGD
jgi:hypothetical protein